MGTTYPVTLGTWQASSTTLSGHALQAGGALVPGGTGGTSITLARRHKTEVRVELAHGRPLPTFGPSKRGKAKATSLPFTHHPSSASLVCWQPGTYLSTIITRSTISTTGTLGTGGALHTTFTREASLTLGRGGRKGGQGCHGDGGHQAGAKSQLGSEWGSAYPGTSRPGGTSISRDTL